MTVKKKQSYIVVLDWMVEKYHLKGNELLAYALIYGFIRTRKASIRAATPTSASGSASTALQRSAF